MNSRQPPTQVYKHVHYHYHYDVNDRNSIQPNYNEKYSNRSTITPQQSHIFPEKSSWKNHINPQITRLYDQISLNQSFQQTYTPKASRFSYRPTRQYSHIRKESDGKYQTNSRKELFQQIQKYQEYLKKRSASNLFIPNSTNQIQFGYQTTEEFENQKIYQQDFNQKQRIPSIQLIRSKKQKPSIRYTESTFQNADTRTLGEKNCQSTTARQQYEIMKQSEFKSNKDERNNQVSLELIGKSQIHKQDRNSIVNKAKIRLSHIEAEPNRYEEQNSNFSLFQRDPKKQSLKESIEGNQEIIKQSAQIKVKQKNQKIQTIISQQSKKQDESYTAYKYKLMKQECDYLRNRFVQHIKNVHQHKI